MGGTADIDEIWRSMQSKDDAYSLVDKKHAQPKAKTLTSVIPQIGKPFDIESVSQAPIPIEVARKKSTSNSICDELFDGINIETSLASIGGGDSDDEDDDNNPNNTSDEEPNLCRLERLSSLLRSDDVVSRIQTLVKLKDVITTLGQSCDTPPELNFPPPYDKTTIKLNQNLSLVSDLARPPNLPQGGTNDVLQPDSPSVLNNSSIADATTTKVNLQTILDTCGSVLFCLIGDSTSERCRCLSLDCIQSLLLAGIDIGRHVPYLIPALAARFPSCSYDKDLEVFVQDSQSHELYKRGGAIDRQDRDGLLAPNCSFHVIEPSEELRLELCRTFSCLLRGLLVRDAVMILDAYFPEMIYSLQASLKDPFPNVKVEACRILVQLLRVSNWELGAKFFATGIARSVLPNCRHRNTKVVISAMDLLEASVCVPDRAKVKGAGTSAISDLVGFREENVLPIAAFYDPKYSVSVNTLAELASHKNPRVRLRCCKMLSSLLVLLPDRYDHQQRLLPYVLSFINDNSVDVQEAALGCIENCGSQYECEHPGDVIERRQLGVDGEATIDYDIGLPNPFTHRPSLGARLYVRSNTGRFFLAILGELSNWREQTRKRSAELLLTLIVYCEERLTKDFQHTLNSIAKVVEMERTSQREHDHLKILDTICEILQLASKYVDPLAYLPLMLPRIVGDTSSATTNSEDGTVSERTRCSYVTILVSLIKGSSLHRLLSHWQHLATLFTSTNCIGSFVGTQIRAESLNALSVLIGKVSNEKDVIIFVSYLTDIGETLKARSTLLVCNEALLNCDEKLATECSDKIVKIISCINQYRG